MSPVGGRGIECPSRGEWDMLADMATRLSCNVNSARQTE